MTVSRHGISIGSERVGNEIFLTLKVIGKLLHEDYEKINPIIVAALEAVKDPQVKVLVDCTELEGWELRAVWDDLKLGLKHGNEFNKIAIYGNKTWQEYMAKIGSWFISGEAKFFDNLADAATWLNED